MSKNYNLVGYLLVLFAFVSIFLCGYNLGISQMQEKAAQIKVGKYIKENGQINFTWIANH